MEKHTIAQRVAAIEDKLAIKFVLDEFSNLADTKETDKQVLLFTEDGVVESVIAGQPPIILNGREQIKQAFSAFLADFETVYHQNGQQTIRLDGEKAETVSYCKVTLVGHQNEKQTKTTFYIIYRDSFVRIYSHWMISHRIADFVYQETEEIR